MAPRYDPAFDVAGLPSPFGVYFPVFITNLYAQAIYITALMISPPAGWTDSEQNVAYLSAGSNVRTEKSNATRTTPATPSNETITVRFNYRTGSYAGPIIGFDDFTFTIYWETITTATIDSTEDFESPCTPGPPKLCEGWSLTNMVGTTTFDRVTSPVVHGAYALQILPTVAGCECYISKQVGIGAGTRAYLFGYINFPQSPYAGRCSIVSPIETLEIVYIAQGVWRRFGVRLNPGGPNTVQIWWRNYWGPYQMVVDYLRWVHY